MQGAATANQKFNDEKGAVIFAAGGFHEDAIANSPFST